MTHTRKIPYTKEELHELFEYDKGILKHKVSRGRVKAGSVAGSISSSGYLCTKIDGRVYLVHRLIWLMFNGSIDKNMQIDHINRKPLDNRIQNLRLVTQQQNKFNTKVKGYSFHKLSNKYRARIMIDGEHIHLGLFEKERDAKDAYLKAKEKYHIIKERK